MKRLLIFIFLLLTNLFVAFACFWDYDTIEMERQQFPSVIELISGKFLRHSPEYHYWRIKDREKKIKEHPDSLNFYDDLAVSYSKIGNDKKAIELMILKEEKQPKLYETYANLGTFYLHDGQFEKGIEYIDKAIKINPEAHFGREVYQKHLAEYVLSKMKDGKITLPLDRDFPHSPDYLVYSSNKGNNFYRLLLSKHNKKLLNLNQDTVKELPEEELEKAIIGIMGMMKFGNFNSPILLETLGDLLLNNGRGDAARQLAARAYFKASYEVEDKNSKEIYKKRIVFVLFHQFTSKQGKKFTLYELEDLLKEEIKEGDNFYQQIRSDEINWINSGKNPEKEFASKYYAEPKVSERIQHGKGGRHDIESKYIQDTSIGTIYDLRPVPKHAISIDSNQKVIIDSLFERKLEKEIKVNHKTDNNLKVKTSNKTIYSLIVGLILICFIGIIIWYKKK